MLDRMTSLTSGARALLVAAVAATGLLSSAAPALAHGEHAQDSFLRTRTIAFYDVRFSDGPDIQVGDRFAITGKFYVPRSWPKAARDPEVAALTVAAPGPVLLVKDRRIGGEFVPQAIELEKGRSYEFRIDLQARREGRFHVHPMITVEGVGPLIGPGMWFEIAGAPGGEDFENVVTLKNGDRVNLETYNRSNVMAWHLAYLIPGILFLGYWLRKPLVQRLAMINAGAAPDDLVTKRDVKVSVGIGAVTLAIVAAGAVYSATEWPDGVPLQVRNNTPAGELAADDVAARAVGSGTFDAERDEVRLELRLRNDGSERLTLRDYSTGNLRFAPGDGEATGRLLTSGPVVLAPGEERKVMVTLQSEKWIEEELIPSTEVEVAVGGIMRFTAPDGSERLAEVNAPVVTSGHTAQHQ